MKFNFIKIICLVITLSMVFMIFGCGDNPNGPNTPDNITPDELNFDISSDVKAELEIMVPGGNSNERTMINCLIDDFSLMYPNVTIEMSYVSVDNYVDSVRRQVLGNTLPDILWSNSPDFYDLIEAETFTNLTPYIEASEKMDIFPTYIGEDGNPSKFVFNDLYVEYFDMGKANGKNYVVPRSCDSVITFLNTDILEKAGVDLNPATTKVKNGWTWDDFMDVCAQVRTYMDTHGMGGNYVIDANLTSWLSVCYPMMLSFGGDVLDENGNNIINSEGNRKAVELVREMVEKRYINDSTVATTSSYDNGGSAMLFQSASVSLYANRKALKGKVDLVSFPLIMDNNTPKIGAGIAGYAISSSSKNKEIAWAFLMYLLSYQGQQKMALNGLNLASIRKDLSDPEVANWGKEFKDLNLAAYTFGSEYKKSTDFFIRASLTAKSPLDQAVRQMFISAQNASKDITKLLETAKRDVDDALVEY